MPIVDSTQTQSVAPGAGGMSWAQIREMANKRTDRRGEKTLDLDYELLSAVIDFCNEYKWFWRRVTATLTTITDQAVYALGDSNVQCEKIIKGYYVSGPNQKNQLSLVTDEDEMVNMLEGFDDPAEPGKFMREPSTWNSIRINTPNQDGYKLRFLYWGLPMLNTDSIGEPVPLVPPDLHPILVVALEKRILRYTIGEGAGKYVAASSEYDRLLAKASENKYGVEGVVREYKSAEDGIRSTNLNDMHYRRW